MTRNAHLPQSSQASQQAKSLVWANVWVAHPKWLYAAVSLLAIASMLLATSVWAPQFQQWEERLSSRTWSLANPSATERRVVVVDIDEKSTQALGPWPWPRDRMAALLQSLDAQGVNLKVVDVLFDGQQPQDPELGNALQSGAPTVISQLLSLNPEAQLQSGQLSGALPGPMAGACKGTQAFGFMSPTSSLAQGVSVGHITPVVDPDGGIRRVPAVLCYQGQAYPALALAALSAATDSQPTFTHLNALTGPAQSIEVGGLVLPVDEQGLLRVSYQMPRAGFVSVSAVDVMQGKVPAELLKGAWVLVGSTAFGGGDAVPTPQGGAVGGVEVHAQILSAALDARTPFVPLWAKAWPFLAGGVSLLFLLLALRWSGAKAAWVVPAVAVANVGGLFGVHAVLLLHFHQWLGWGQPAVFVALAATLLTAAELVRMRAERERLFQNLSSYLPESAARKVALQEPSEQVQAETRQATVMLVDLRNFSAYCEERTPEDAATVLHLFYTTLDAIVSAHGGVVEQMVGDGLTAVWNGSLPCDQHAQKAVAAASVIREQGVAQLPQGGSRKTPPLDIGIGIETGPVMVGSFGPARRRVHTVMGETVSVASRLEKLTAELGYPILLGPNLHAALNAQEDVNSEPENAAYKFQKLGNFLLAGMRAPRTVYALPVNIDPSRLHLISGLDSEISMIG